MDLSGHFNNRVMAMLPSALDRLRVMSQDAPDINNLQTSYEEQKKSVANLYGEQQKPRLVNGTIGDNGVAIINIKGSLFNVECYFDEIIAFYFGGTSYQSLMRDIELVTNDSDVQAVGFFVHSPGGDAFGMSETSSKIAALAAKKPTISYAYGLAASAGYGLIAGTGEIVADATALIGSIGTVTRWADYTGMYEMLGIAFEEVTSSNAPYKRLDIRIPEERAIFMKELDGVEDVFIKLVAKSRGISVEKVKSDFGQGAVMAGKAARSAGMIDTIGSWDEVLKQLQTKAKKASKISAEKTADKGENFMSIGNTIKEFFSRKEVQSILNSEDDAAETVSAATETSATAAAPTASAPDVPTAPNADSAALIVGFKATAESFAVSEIKAGRMSPREKDDFVENYAQAAFDDSVSPLASGSRVERLKAQSANRKANLLTEETVHDETNQVLLASPGTVSAADKKAKLLATTPLGKRTLNSQK